MSGGKEPKHIIEGFSDDLVTVAEKFAARHPECELLGFLNFWDDEHLDCLFANRFDPRELIEAISEMNSNLTDTLLAPHHQDMIKIVAIYLLLCIYMRQPERFRCKLRWTCQDLISIETWCNTMVDKSNNPHPRQALGQLKAFRAFDLVEERKMYGPSLIRRGAKDLEEKSNHCSSPVTEELRETMEFLECKIEPSLSEMANIHAQYDAFRQALQLSNYKEFGEQTSTDTSPGLYLKRAINSVAEFKSNEQTISNTGTIDM